MEAKFQINNNILSKDSKAYFIADIAANHDGDLKQAKELFRLAKASGADAVKMQHHNVKKYVSDIGFKALGSKQSHQASWGKSIFEVYKSAEVPLDWTNELVAWAQELKIDFFTTPYDLDMVDVLKNHVSAFKVGSGDLNWDEMLIKVARTGKPVIVASGACTIGEVQHAMSVLQKHTDQIALLQCNTNYTGSIENFKFINLNVLKTYATMYPDILIGLSDHTPGDVTVLGAIALGAKIIEKHFTDDTNRPGPDHPFSMDPKSWEKMVRDSRLLEAALGRSIKETEENEAETVVLQRRAIRVLRNMKKGQAIKRGDIEFQRPAPKEAYRPNDVTNVLDKTLSRDIGAGSHLSPFYFETGQE